MTTPRGQRLVAILDANANRLELAVSTVPTNKQAVSRISHLAPSLPPLSVSRRGLLVLPCPATPPPPKTPTVASGINAGSGGAAAAAAHRGATQHPEKKRLISNMG